MHHRSNPWPPSVRSRLRQKRLYSAAFVAGTKSQRQPRERGLFLEMATEPDSLLKRTSRTNQTSLARHSLPSNVVVKRCQPIPAHTATDERPKLIFVNVSSLGFDLPWPWKSAHFLGAVVYSAQCVHLGTACHMLVRFCGCLACVHAACQKKRNCARCRDPPSVMESGAFYN